ncbi:hypothetical protein ACFORL_00245 [Legionella dresdenensis]|uniref:Integral membrane protein (PIN domain superfamily) n=1 Tax=Legionella dresdenensis TaxID=450200 RepID=A0ABV8CBS7_9GAMM
MDTSKFLSKVLGIYFIIVSVAMYVDMQQFTGYVQRLIHDPTLMFVTGFFTLILGILMVVSHNIWQWNWRLLITIIAWIVLLKGIGIIFLPHFIDTVSLSFVENIYMTYAAAGLDLLLGLFLCYKGFKE